jgi:hypothetical protein
VKRRLGCPLPLHFQKVGEAGRICAEFAPGRSKPLHAILPIFAYALSVDLAHGDHVVDVTDREDATAWGRCRPNALDEWRALATRKATASWSK